MQAEIISIGDELTTGQRLDTNSQWVSQQLEDLGIRISGHRTLADDLAENVRGFRQAADHSDVVVATGGLGPTADDLTRDALAAVAGVDLVQDDASLAHIRALFARRARPMPERNVVQALFPRGSFPIANPEGTAPGIHLALALGSHTCHIFALPGVPAEMKTMWHESVVPELKRLGGGQQVIRHRRIKCFGAGESDVEQMLPDLIRRGRTPLVGITVHEATITLRVTALAATEAECYSQMEPTLAEIRQCLGKLVFGDEDDELEHAVMRLVEARGQTLSTAEYGLEGLLAHWLAATRSDSYLSATIFGSQRAVERRLGLIAPGSHSAKIAEQLAVESCHDSGSDVALAAYLPAAVEEPRHVYFAVARGQAIRTHRVPYVGHPSILLPRAAKQALDFLRLSLLEERLTPPR